MIINALLERLTWKVYLAGPMRGIPQFNFPAFADATVKLRNEGYEVFSPAEHAISLHGQSFWDNINGDEVNLPLGFDRRALLAADLNWICREANAVALLPGWETSKGALAEMATALALGLEIIKL